MYRPKTKRRQIVMRTLVYAFMTLSVLTIVTILMLVILGYSFNRQDGRLEQGGLLQFASTPSGATVTLDGLQTASRTPSKASVDAKSHHVKMDLKNYRSWQKTIDVKAGGIGWLSYARFIPNKVEVEQMRVFPQLAASLASDNRRWIVAQETLSSPTFTLVNIESDSPKYTELTIPESALTSPATAAPQEYSIVTWNKDADRLLVKRTYDTDKTEWLLVNRPDPADSINITATFGIDAADIKFGERNGSDAYALAQDSTVRRLEFGNNTLSGPLAENVEEYSVYENSTLLYTTKPDGTPLNQRHVGYREDSMDVPQTVFSYTADTPNIHVAFGEYYGKNYVAVTHGTTMQIFVGTLPKGTTKANLKQLATIDLPDAPLRLSIGDNGRLAVAQMANGFTTYDIELEKKDTTIFTKPSASLRPLVWIDDYMIANDRGNVMRFYDFDGANQQDIMPVIEGQAMSLTGNEKFVYGFNTAEGGVSFNRGRLVISN